MEPPLLPAGSHAAALYGGHLGRLAPSARATQLQRESIAEAPLVGRETSIQQRVARHLATSDEFSLTAIPATPAAARPDAIATTAASSAATTPSYFLRREGVYTFSPNNPRPPATADTPPPTDRLSRRLHVPAPLAQTPVLRVVADLHAPTPTTTSPRPASAHASSVSSSLASFVNGEAEATGGRGVEDEGAHLGMMMSGLDLLAGATTTGNSSGRRGAGNGYVLPAAGVSFPSASRGTTALSYSGRHAAASAAKSSAATSSTIYAPGSTPASATQRRHRPIDGYAGVPPPPSPSAQQSLNTAFPWREGGGDPYTSGSPTAGVVTKTGDGGGGGGGRMSKRGVFNVDAMHSGGGAGGGGSSRNSSHSRASAAAAEDDTDGEGLAAGVAVHTEALRRALRAALPARYESASALLRARLARSDGDRDGNLSDAEVVSVLTSLDPRVQRVGIVVESPGHAAAVSARGKGASEVYGGDTSMAASSPGGSSVGDGNSGLLRRLDARDVARVLTSAYDEEVARSGRAVHGDIDALTRWVLAEPHPSSSSFPHIIQQLQQQQQQQQQRRGDENGFPLAAAQREELTQHPEDMVGGGSGLSCDGDAASVGDYYVGDWSGLQRAPQQPQQQPSTRAYGNGGDRRAFPSQHAPQPQPQRGHATSSSTGAASVSGAAASRRWDDFRADWVNKYGAGGAAEMRADAANSASSSFSSGTVPGGVGSSSSSSSGSGNSYPVPFRVVHLTAGPPLSPSAAAHAHASTAAAGQRS